MQNKKSLGQKLKNVAKSSVATVAIGAVGLAGAIGLYNPIKAYAYDFASGRQVYLVHDLADPVIPAETPSENIYLIPETDPANNFPENSYSAMEGFYSNENLGIIPEPGPNTPTLQANVGTAWIGFGARKNIRRPVNFQGVSKGNSKLSAVLINRYYLELNDMTLTRCPGENGTIIYDKNTSGVINNCEIRSLIHVEQAEGNISVNSCSFTNWDAAGNPYCISIYGYPSKAEPTSVTFYNNEVILPDGITAFYLENQAKLEAGFGVDGNNYFDVSIVAEIPGTNNSEQPFIGDAFIDPTVKRGAKTGAKADGNVYLTDVDEIKTKLFTGRTDNVIIERPLGYNPQSTTEDVDNDGLSNRSELYYGTNPELADTDGDGVNDGMEASFGYDPLNNESYPELPASTLSGLAALVGLGAIGGALAVRKPKRRN